MWRENECCECTETEEEESRRLVQQVALQLVEANMSLAKPICAAAHLVAVNDVEAAVQLLLKCGGNASTSCHVCVVLVVMRYVML